MMDGPPAAIPRLVFAGPESGAGKTTVAAAAMRAFTLRGLRVAPFKVGPDYLDPTHHAAAAGRPSRNLDGWLLPHPTVLALFRRATSGERAADLALIEGVMGLFDGRSPTSEEGSTAEMARLLAAPVVLVLDASAMARTAAAVVQGLHRFDPALRLSGVVLNRLGGARHYAICRDAIRSSTDVPVLGWLPRDPAFSIPERHLGLVAARETRMDVELLAARAAETLDLDALLALARSAGPLPAGPDPLPRSTSGARPVIAVARDAAFDFYYEDNLDLLRDLGAELRFFSPLLSDALPEGAAALYLGGGYPELHGRQLAGNARMRSAIRRFAEEGAPVYAECGGLMYLASELVDLAGERHPMVGLVPGASTMGERLSIGYREVTALRDSPIAEAGWTVRGHEFHHSTLAHPPAPAAYRRVDGAETEGSIAGPAGNVLASYLHVHFAADPRLAERFVGRARAFAAGRTEPTSPRIR